MVVWLGESGILVNSNREQTRGDNLVHIRKLVDLTIHGDRSATEELFSQAYIYVYAYVRHMCGNEDTAKDLTQEALARAIANLTRFRNESNFNTWVCGIASNTYKDFVKKQSKQRMIVNGDSHGVSSDCHSVGGASHPDVQDMYQKREFEADLSSALKALPKPQREAFVLKHLSGLSYEQVAEILNCPIGTVRSRLHHGIATLQKILKERGWP